jgi:hypothetical protein
MLAALFFKESKYSVVVVGQYRVASCPVAEQTVRLMTFSDMGNCFGSKFS